MISSSRSMLLLHSDPAFAAGAGSFSAGLETLTREGWVRTSSELEDAIFEALESRWNTFDRIFLARAYAADADVDRLSDHNAEIETELIGLASRQSSRRAGSALLGLWARLGYADAARLREILPGGVHLPIAQGMVARMHSLSLPDIEFLAGWSMVSSYASSAVRLSVSGHSKIQRILIRSAERLKSLLETRVDPNAVPYAWTPHHDIAIERHRKSKLKLFAS